MNWLPPFLMRDTNDPRPWDAPRPIWALLGVVVLAILLGVVALLLSLFLVLVTHTTCVW